MVKRNICFIVCILLVINVLGCSVSRVVETRMDYGLKKVAKTEVKVIFSLDYNHEDGLLKVRLAEQPYQIYKPKLTLNDVGIGLAALGLWSLVFYDNWDHDNTFDFSDDTFDWYDSELWEKVVLIGVPTDILLFWTFSYPFDWKKIELREIPLIDHPYRLQLPDHGNIGVDYKTLTGIDQIKVTEFKSNLGNRVYIQNTIGDLKIQASTTVNNKRYLSNYTIPNIPNGPVPVPIPGIATTIKWRVNPIKSGERAILDITAENTGKKTITGLTATINSTNPYFVVNDDLIFRNLGPREKDTKAIAFSPDPNLQNAEILINVIFITLNGDVNQEDSITLTIRE